MHANIIFKLYKKIWSCYIDLSSRGGGRLEGTDGQLGMYSKKKDWKVQTDGRYRQTDGQLTFRNVVKKKKLDRLPKNISLLKAFKWEIVQWKLFKEKLFSGNCSKIWELFGNCLKRNCSKIWELFIIVPKLFISELFIWEIVQSFHMRNCSKLSYEKLFIWEIVQSFHMRNCSYEKLCILKLFSICT